jgi:hypothetical protein
MVIESSIMGMIQIIKFLKYCNVIFFLSDYCLFFVLRYQNHSKTAMNKRKHDKQSDEAKKPRQKKRKLEPEEELSKEPKELSQTGASVFSSQSLLRLIAQFLLLNDQRRLVHVSKAWQTACNHPIVWNTVHMSIDTLNKDPDERPSLVSPFVRMSIMETKTLFLGHGSYKLIHLPKAILNDKYLALETLVISGMLDCDGIHRLQSWRENGLPNLKQLIFTPNCTYSMVDGSDNVRDLLYKEFGSDELAEFPDLSKKATTKQGLNVCCKTARITCCFVCKKQRDPGNFTHACENHDYRKGFCRNLTPWKKRFQQCFGCYKYVCSQECLDEGLRNQPKMFQTCDVCDTTFCYVCNEANGEEYETCAACTKNSCGYCMKKCVRCSESCCNQCVEFHECVDCRKARQDRSESDESEDEDEVMIVSEE